MDVGTGFYVEKDTKSASEFYDEKVKELGANIADLEVIVQSKTNNLRVVEEGKTEAINLLFVNKVPLIHMLTSDLVISF